MKDFDALKDIWTGQVASPKSNYEDTLAVIKKKKSVLASKLLIDSVLTSVVIVLLGLIWLFSSFVLLTSHLSMSILLACSIYYLIVQLQAFKSIHDAESYLEQPDKYIAHLKRYQQKRHVLNTRNFTVYSIFTGLAFALYLIEVCIAAPLWQGIAGIIFTIAWFVICALLMRSYKRKEHERLSDMISNLEKLENQFFV